MLKIQKIIAPGLMLLALSACGGGGGGGTTTPPPPANAAPVVASANANQSGVVGFDFSYDASQGGATFTDPDGDTLTYSVVFSPTDAGLTASGAAISGRPSQFVDITVTITASDGKGGTASNSFSVFVDVEQTAVLAKFGGRIDLKNLPDYETFSPPSYITKFNAGGNPVSDAGAILGRVLFYDMALSIDDTVSCSSCHVQANGFSDLGTVSDGVLGGTTRRHSMRLINTQYANETRFFWDERAVTHEAQETMPLEDFNEHGFSGTNGRPDINDLIAKLEALDYYQDLFRFVYQDTTITEARLQLALAQFTKSIYSFDSKYDEGRAQVGSDSANFPNFTNGENAGKTLFLTPPPQGGAGCFRCHSAPEFDIMPNVNGHNGVVAEAADPTQSDFTNTRAPTLRDLVDPSGNLNGPLMHNGAMTTLRMVLDHYDNIPVPATEPERTAFLNSIDMRLRMGGATPAPLNLSPTDKDNLEAFLRTLSGSNVYTDVKWNNPF
jgi:cytochrome c peroxidase